MPTRAPVTPTFLLICRPFKRVCLVAGALRSYPAAESRHVALAGSVVRTDFAGKDYLSSGRIEGLLNYVATRNLVVAGFPRAVNASACSTWAAAAMTASGISDRNG